MADEKMESALKVYNTICATLESHGWHYTKNDEKLNVECGAQGEDLPMDITIWVNPENQLIALYSHLPFIIPEDKRLDVAVAISVVNYRLVEGCFDYDIAGGHVLFRMTSSFMDSEIGNDLIYDMLKFSCIIIDEFNDKFLMIGKGMIGIDDFIANN